MASERSCGPRQWTLEIGRFRQRAGGGLLLGRQVKQASAAADRTSERTSPGSAGMRPSAALGFTRLRDALGDVVVADGGGACGWLYDQPTSEERRQRRAR